MTVADIADSLYSGLPKTTLYHYTTLRGLIGIVQTRSLYATEIRYVNDSSEMLHVSIRLQEAASRRADANPHYRRMYDQFKPWVADRLVSGHMLYVTPFSANGNVLSQWRGYCGEGGTGVSLGFDSEAIQVVAHQHSFSVGRCEYDPKRQQAILNDVLVAVETLADAMGENTDKSKRHPDNAYFDVFENVEMDLLRVAVLLKHHAFQEEEEYRAVSTLTNYVTHPIEYRATKSMLVPFVRFNLPLADVSQDVKTIGLERVFVGPTPHINQLMNSVDRFLSKEHFLVKHAIINCQIPFRTL